MLKVNNYFFYELSIVWLNVYAPYINQVHFTRFRIQLD